MSNLDRCDERPITSRPSIASSHQLLYHHRHVLLHSLVTGASRVLIVCPQELAPVAKTLTDIIRYHPVGFGGSVLAVHLDASTLPTVDAIRQSFEKGRKYPHLDLVVIYGYSGTQINVKDVELKRWMDNLGEFIRPGIDRRGVQRTRAILLLEIASKSGESWEGMAKRWDDFVHDIGICLDSVNSLHRSNATDIKIAAARNTTLARNLSKIPGGVHRRLVAYLESYADILKTCVRGIEKKGINKGDSLLGLFIPDASTASSEESWWVSVDSWEQNEDNEKSKTTKVEEDDESEEQEMEHGI